MKADTEKGHSGRQVRPMWVSSPILLREAQSLGNQRPIHLPAYVQTWQWVDVLSLPHTTTMVTSTFIFCDPSYLKLLSLGLSLKQNATLFPEEFTSKKVYQMGAQNHRWNVDCPTKQSSSGGTDNIFRDAWGQIKDR